MSLPHTKSEPAIAVLSLTPKQKPQTKRRKSTLTNTEEHYNPQFVLQLILSQPYYASIGISTKLRPLIELAIRDLHEESSSSYNELIDEALIRLKIDEEFQSFVPL